MNFIKTFLAGLLAVVVGTFLVFFLWIFILLGIAGSMEKSVAVHPESILKIDFSEVLTDAPSSDPLAGLDLMTLQTQRQLPLLKALRALEAARDDDRIKGIYLRMNGTGGVTGSAILEELREALVEFKQSGKFVVAYDETYSQGKYYLASAADKIYMQPEGAMDWSGLAFNLMFYKGLLDKLDIKAEVFRPTACKYKSAVEPYILPKMSDANREQMQALVNSMWNTIAGSVAEARGIDLKELNRITDKLEVSLPEDALEHGFVDSLIYENYNDLPTEEIHEMLHRVDDRRIFVIAEALRRGISAEEIHDITKVDIWFIDKINNIVQEEKLLRETPEITKEMMQEAKRMEFPDKVIAQITGKKEKEIKELRYGYGIHASYKIVDTCAAEFEAETPYYYSCYDGESEVEVDENKKKIMVLGSGPIRIGQGIEFDYCSEHSTWTLKNKGYETIIVNNNPETVSTDFDIADRLYFEPLTAEDVESIVNIEKPDGAVVQFGGQTAIKLTEALLEMGVPILGTSAENVDAAEDRELFDDLQLRKH